jgi:hypothetical protein
MRGFKSIIVFDNLTEEKYSEVLKYLYKPAEASRSLHEYHVG